MMDGQNIIHESPASTIYRATFNEQPCVVKVGYITRKYSPEPHDILKEAKIIAELSHYNIIDALGHGTHATRHDDLYCLWLPFIPHCLEDLLCSPFLSPHAPPIPSPSGTTQAQDFDVITKSLSWQILSAVSYLHSPAVQIAHRDLKPTNFLITELGRVQLIDFGVAHRARADSARQLWPEAPRATYTQVCTGPYRPPELLFGAQGYDAGAVDRWALGAVLAEFFTALRLEDDEDDEDEEDSDLESESGEDAGGVGMRPFVVMARAGPDARWTREALFDAERGDIGLAWSIFQIRGTPDGRSWPDFLELPHARKLTFKDAPGVPLQSRLPNLPPHHAAARISAAALNHFPEETLQAKPLDLIHRLLVYPPARRLGASDALQHPWLTEGVVLLPEDFPLDGRASNAITAWEGRSLGDVLSHYWS